MPRLTNQRYLEIHHQLHQSWLQHRYPFAGLTAREQWDLHHFFIPAEQRTDTELLEHRAQITAADFSLPQRAGRAYRHFEVERSKPQVPLVHVPHTKSNRPIVVRGLVRPQPDMEKFVGALLEVARSMQT